MILTRKTKIVGVVVILLALVAVVAFALMASGQTYVRIVDGSSIPDDTTPAPGADINAVEVVKSQKTESVFASAVIATQLRDAANGTANTAKDGASALGSPQDDQDPKYVSLGAGGQIIVKLDAALKSGDQLLVHEIGSESGPRAEYYEVFISRNADGPWTSLGSVAGPHTFVFEGDSPFRD
jgi:hypothetical protein